MSSFNTVARAPLILRRSSTRRKWNLANWATRSEKSLGNYRTVNVIYYLPSTPISAALYELKNIIFLLAHCTTIPHQVNRKGQRRSFRSFTFLDSPLFVFASISGAEANRTKSISINFHSPPDPQLRKSPSALNAWMSHNLFNKPAKCDSRHFQENEGETSPEN